jgi:hypothetical protein
VALYGLPMTAAIVNTKTLKNFMQIGHPAFKLCEFLYFSKRITLNLTFKITEFRGHLFLEGSPYNEKEIVQIGPFLFELSVFLYSSTHMTLKMTLKIKEFWGHHFREGSPCLDEQSQNNLIKIGLSVYELFAFLNS